MPYIEQRLRDQLDVFAHQTSAAIERMMRHEGSWTGMANYAITQILLDLTTPPTYGKLAQAVGVLETVKLELYRRVAVPYERNKAVVNGDVFPEADR